MLVDWITARIHFDNLTCEVVEQLRKIPDRIIRLDSSGAIKWEVAAWDSLRSDSHGVAYRVGSDALWIQGSPLRVQGAGDNTFSMVDYSLDLPSLLADQVRFVSDLLNVSLPCPLQFPEKYALSRVDVTQNLFFKDRRSVDSALGVLRGIEGGRYRVSSTYGDTVYFSQRSRLRSGKAYAKGGHLRYQQKSSDTKFSDSILQKADRLLRLELKIGNQAWRERLNNWWLVGPDELAYEWRAFFGRMLNFEDVDMDTDILTALEQNASPAQARAAYATFLLLKQHGLENTKAISSKTTFYRHLQLLRSIGLRDLDFSSGNVVQIKRSPLKFDFVYSWDDLHKAA